MLRMCVERVSSLLFIYLTEISWGQYSGQSLVHSITGTVIVPKSKYCCCHTLWLCIYWMNVSWKMILIVINLILSLKQNWCMRCVWVCVSVYPKPQRCQVSTECCAVQENKSTCSCARRFIYSYYTDVCSIFFVYSRVQWRRQEKWGWQ